MAQQLTTLNKKMEKLEVAAMGTQAEITITCGLCGGPYENHQCCLVKEDQPLEQVNYMGNQPRQPFHDPNASTYNPGWRNHPKTLVGEETRILRTTTFRTVHPTNNSKGHLFNHSNLVYLILNPNHLNQTLLKLH
ncbi:hypothetical protein PIB30_085378 [Stylosanthes scabra]|uniref:Uncharacterized protein n=1 Tax=Stylosanthes scabra TaxID=79078 RepID=A0ABU6WSG9_9FABA|nr:hypothetical protein [Stylosanthes scabra]